MSGLGQIHISLLEEGKALQAECCRREDEIWQCQMVSCTLSPQT